MYSLNSSSNPTRNGDKKVPTDYCEQCEKQYAIVMERLPSFVEEVELDGEIVQLCLYCRVFEHRKYYDAR